MSDIAVVRTGDRTWLIALAASLWGFSSLLREPLSAGDDRCCRDVGLTHTPKLLRDLHISGVIDLAQDCMQGVVANAWAQAERPASILQPHLWVSLFYRNGFTHEGASAEWSCPGIGRSLAGVVEDLFRRVPAIELVTVGAGLQVVGVDENVRRAARP